MHPQPTALLRLAVASTTSPNLPLDPSTPAWQHAIVFGGAQRPMPPRRRKAKYLRPCEEAISSQSRISGLSRLASPAPGDADHLRKKLGPILCNRPGCLVGEQLDFVTLEDSILEWKGVPYRFGGNEKTGIDCSALVQKLLPHRRVPRTTLGQLSTGIERPLNQIALPGDVFIFINKQNANQRHVGLYLGSNFIIHASSSRRKVIVDNVSHLFLTGLQLVQVKAFQWQTHSPFHEQENLTCPTRCDVKESRLS